MPTIKLDGVPREVVSIHFDSEPYAIAYKLDATGDLIPDADNPGEAVMLRIPFKRLEVNWPDGLKE